MSHGRARAAVVALAAALAVVLLAEGFALGGAWAPAEEAAVLDRARGGSLLTDRSSGAAYPLLLAPAARTLPAPTAHALARALAALLWAAALVPAYLLARTLLPPAAALPASTLALVGPVGLYAAAALPDALALLLALLAFLLAVRATDRGSVPLLGGAVSLGVLAALARPWLALLPIAIALAYALPRVDGRSRLRWPGSLVFAAGIVGAYAAALVLGAFVPELRAALGDPAAVAAAALTGLASAAAAVLVVPWLLAAAAPPYVRALPLARLALVATPALALGGGVAAAAAPDRALEERALLVLLPLVLPLAARVWLERCAEPVLLAAAGVAVVAAAVALPSLDRPSRGSLGLALAAPGGASRATLALSVVALALLAAVAAAALRRRPAVAAGALGVVLLAGHALAWSEVRKQAREALPEARPLDWVDREAGADARVVAVGPADALPRETLVADGLWNRSLRKAVPLETTHADPETGVLARGPEADYLLARGFEPAGEALSSRGEATLVRGDAEVRVAQTVEGLHEDGWSGPAVVLRRFAGVDAPGVVTVTASRGAWSGPDRPGEVVVSTGPLDGEAEPRARAVISAGQELTLEAEVPPPPFRVVVTVTPTFSPAEFGGTDARQLGAQLSFAFR